MPRIVDHDQRREELCAVASRLIHERGLDAATVRAIAAAAGCSTGVIVHYFEDKDDLLEQVLRYVNRRPIVRVRERLEGEAHPRTFAEWIEEVLPLDEERRMEWNVRLAIWGRRPDLQGEGVSGEPSWLDGATQLVALGQARGILDPTLPTRTIANEIIAVLSGVSLHAVLSPEHFTPDWQREFVVRYAARIGGPASREP